MPSYAPEALIAGDAMFMTLCSLWAHYLAQRRIPI